MALSYMLRLKFKDMAECGNILPIPFCHFILKITTQQQKLWTLWKLLSQDWNWRSLRIKTNLLFWSWSLAWQYLVQCKVITLLNPLVLNYGVTSHIFVHISLISARADGGPRSPSAHAWRVRSSPHRHERKFSGACVCRVVLVLILWIG